MPRPRLSVCVTTYQMGHFLPHLLRNVEPVADEIVVLDSLSTDDTRAVVEAHPRARLLQRPFEGHYGRNKNHAFDAATGDWILLLDSDELLGDRLRRWIPRLVRLPWITHVKIPRYWLTGLSPCTYLHTRDHYPDHQVRLFRNTPFWRYGEDKAVHEHFPREGRGPKLRLRRGHIFHFNFLLADTAARRAKVEQYAALAPDSRDTSERVYDWERAAGSAPGDPAAPHPAPPDERVRPCREPLTAPGLHAQLARPASTARAAEARAAQLASRSS